MAASRKKFRDKADRFFTGKEAKWLESGWEGPFNPNDNALRNERAWLFLKRVFEKRSPIFDWRRTKVIRIDVAGCKGPSNHYGSTLRTEKSWQLLKRIFETKESDF
ncbi:hypothetical protein V3C99_018263 [Haemonchus contortus]